MDNEQNSSPVPCVSATDFVIQINLIDSLPDDVLLDGAQWDAKKRKDYVDSDEEQHNSPIPPIYPLLKRLIL